MNGWRGIGHDSPGRSSFIAWSATSSVRTESLSTSVEDFDLNDITLGVRLRTGRP